MGLPQKPALLIPIKCLEASEPTKFASPTTKANKTAASCRSACNVSPPLNVEFLLCKNTILESSIIINASERNVAFNFLGLYVCNLHSQVGEISRSFQSV